MKRTALGIVCCAILIAGCDDQGESKQPVPAARSSVAPPQKGVVSEKEKLAALVEPTDKESAARIRAERSKVEPVATPFFTGGAIDKVTYFLPSHPIVFTVGQAGDFTVHLAANPSGYIELAQRAGLKLETDEARLAYVTTFLETTRSFADRFEILNDVSQIKPRPTLTADKAKAFEATREAHKSTVRPPAIAGSGPWTATVFALRGQDLVRVDVTLESGGQLRAQDSALAKDLLIPATL
jgi:hypothetical protein